MAMQTIRILKRYRRNDVRFVLLRDIIVTYSRPFTESRGKGIAKDRYGIPKGLSREMKELHKEFLDLRSQLFAHTDLTFKDPKISNWSTSEYKWFPMTLKNFSYKNLDGKLRSIEQLIKENDREIKTKIAEYEELL